MLERLKEIMKESGAHLEGHFLLTSGNHSSDYMQCALLLRFPRYAAFAGEALAKRIAKFSPDIIASPALGGLIIGP
jgi:Orotate phosphoribosyltransferase